MGTRRCDVVKSATATSLPANPSSARFWWEKNFFRKEFNYESEYLWLPDVFGYSWALPQILKNQVSIPS